MSRLHISVTVTDMSEATKFYAAMFGAEPTVLKDDYAKWMLEDPQVNFAIQTREGAPGVSHLGIQAEDAAELETLYARFAEASDTVFEEGKTECCYAQSEKSWVEDPTGVAWEAFVTTGVQDEFGKVLDRDQVAAQLAQATPGASTCCCG